MAAIPNQATTFFPNYARSQLPPKQLARLPVSCLLLSLTLETLVRYRWDCTLLLCLALLEQDCPPTLHTRMMDEYDDTGRTGRLFMIV
jgi:hypothetical protein